MNTAADQRFFVLSRADASDRWQPIGVGPERSPEMAERRIAHCRANGSQREFAFICVSGSEAEQSAALRAFIVRSAPVAPVARVARVAPVAPVAPAKWLRSLFARRSAPMLQLQRFRGAAAGWQAVGAPRSAASAERLSATLARITPEATLRTIPFTA